MLRLDAIVSRFPTTHKGETCRSSIPGFDGHSTLNMLSMHGMLNTLPHQTTLLQYQHAKEAWHQAGQEFRQGQTRFRTYGNDFDAGVLLPEYEGPRPISADMHDTTNFKPPDNRVDDNKIIPLRKVAFATAGLPVCRLGQTKAGLKVER